MHGLVDICTHLAHSPWSRAGLTLPLFTQLMNESVGVEKSKVSRSMSSPCFTVRSPSTCCTTSWGGKSDRVVMPVGKAGRQGRVGWGGGKFQLGGFA